MSALGSDVSLLPTRYPAGDWLTIEAPVLSLDTPVQVTVAPHIDAAPLAGANAATTAIATLDTGAMRTALSRPMAERLGLSVVGGRSTVTFDAHGHTLAAEHVVIPELRVGRRAWRGVDALVLGDEPELFLIGADVLETVDMYIAADDGLIGLFDAGQGPREPDDVVIPLQRDERQLTVRARARSHDGGRDLTFKLIIDTGAWATSVPLVAGINGGLAADLRYESTSVAVGSELTQRGRFVLDPLWLGPIERPVAVDRVLALGSTLSVPPHTHEIGLLGNDVLMRQHTLVSFARAELRLRPPSTRPAERWRGPGDQPCHDDAGVTTPCIRVALTPNAGLTYGPEDMPGVCLQVDVDERYAGRTLELTVATARGALMNGGAIRTFLTANASGAHTCFKLWRQLEHLGITASTPVSLRWVRTEGIHWPCDPMKTRCITFTGPLALPSVR